jgi:hypothetical protein
MCNNTYKIKKSALRRKYGLKKLIFLLKLLKFLIKPPISFLKKLKRLLLKKINEDAKMLKKHIKKNKRG